MLYTKQQTGEKVIHVVLSIRSCFNTAFFRLPGDLAYLAFAYLGDLANPLILKKKWPV